MRDQTGAAVLALAAFAAAFILGLGLHAAEAQAQGGFVEHELREPVVLDDESPALSNCRVLLAIQGTAPSETSSSGATT